MAGEDDYYAFDNESLLRSKSNATGVQRGESLVRRERNDFRNPDNPHHYYAQKAQEQQQKGHVQVQESIPLQDMSYRPTKSVPAPKAKSLSFWQIYCYVVTFWAPAPLLSLFGMKKTERQFAWREKMALLSVIFYAGAFVAYLTFGFTRTVCSSSVVRFRNNEVTTSYLIINGKSYGLDSSSHPAAAGIDAGTNVLYPPINAGGMDASFLFQNVNGNCKGLLTPRDNCSIPYSDENLAWYFPCKLVAQDGSTQPNFTKNEYYDGWACHTSESAREQYYQLSAAADVYFTWDDIKNSTRNLVVYNGHVLDLDLLKWLQTDDLNYPPLFDQLRQSKLQGYDISLVLSDSFERKAALCLSEIIKVGEIDSSTIGCLASQVVLYISLVFILSVVFLKFFISCYFRWVVAKRQGASTVDNKSLNQHANEIEDWSEDINARGPIKKVDPYMRPGDQRRVSTFDLIKKNSRMLLNDKDDSKDKFRGMTTMTTQSYLRSNDHGFAADKNALQSPFTNDLVSSAQNLETLDPTIIHPDVVAQPPADYMPSSFPLIHTVCFVTCYSEDEQGLRTTLDSLSTTDYPNSHKLLMVVCDGIIKGSGNDLTTPEIALSMMEDFVVPPEEVEAHSYVAVASGSKRHNMAKVYAGFYKYDNSTIQPELQQRVPMIVVVKCGTPDEQGSVKPGNRGKRDSQVLFMSFLQRLTFEERMTVFEYHLLKNIWQITGLMADFYELVLMVDADTKVYPDSLTHMAAEMVKDPEIMGLCGETKISNKRDSWVSWIQVFEYYISHHQAKAFESVFGSVTCLPGCFSIYRIKAPKGNDGYWVPILANPDVVERYSDNDTSTLHKKNLLLLGEDRFLSSLMLKTFPKRKQVFVPKAACKTIVPNQFKVLLSQRRRWINSTVHNLMELVLINDLCGS